MDGKLPVIDITLTEDALQLDTKIVGKVAVQRSEAIEPHT